MKTLLLVVFTGIYFTCFFFLLDLVFRQFSLGSIINISAIVCLFIAFLVSVGLAQATIHKLTSSHTEK